MQGIQIYKPKEALSKLPQLALGEQYNLTLKT